MMKLSQFFYLAAEKQQEYPPLPDNGMCITLHDIMLTLNSSQGQALHARAKRLLNMFYPEYGNGIQQLGSWHCCSSAYWANRWSDHNRVVKRCRVLCLLFCAAIAEAQERRRRRRTKNSNKQRVLRVYPNAYVCMVHRGVYRLRHHHGYVVVSDAHGFDLGRYCDRPSAAWASAARSQAIRVMERVRNR